MLSKLPDKPDLEVRLEIFLCGDTDSLDFAPLLDPLDSILFPKEAVLHVAATCFDVIAEATNIDVHYCFLKLYRQGRLITHPFVDPTGRAKLSVKTFLYWMWH